MAFSEVPDIHVASMCETTTEKRTSLIGTLRLVAVVSTIEVPLNI